MSITAWHEWSIVVSGLGETQGRNLITCDDSICVHQIAAIASEPDFLTTAVGARSAAEVAAAAVGVDTEIPSSDAGAGIPVSGTPRVQIGLASDNTSKMMATGRINVRARWPMASDRYLRFLNHYSNVNAEKNFRRAYEDSWGGIDRSSEVSAIRSYLLDSGVGIDRLNAEVAPALSNESYDFKFAGLFCHQKPRVTRTKTSASNCVGDTPSCELGDLYVVFVLLEKSGSCIYASSALFQAKLQAKLDSKSQRCLYDCDADFEVPRYLEKRLVPPNKTRELPLASEGRSRGLRYLILNPTGVVTDVRSRFSPWNNNYQQRWSTFLDGLVSGTDGISLSPGASVTRWDVISDDLLQVGVVSARDGKGRGTNLPTRVATGLFNDFSYAERTTHIYDGDGGIPTLFVIAHERQG